MNRNYTLIIAIFLLSVNTYAQGYYKFKTGTSAYTALHSPVPVTLEDPQGSGRYFSFNFNMPTFNHTGVFKGDQTTSLGAFMAYDGYVAVYNVSQSHTVVYQVMLPESGSALRFAAGSSMGYKYEGNAGAGILKVEWKNMRITGHHDSEFVNFQAWFDESDKSITYHYGPKNITSDFRFFSSIFSTLNTNFGTFDNAINLSGNPASPSVSSAANFATMPVIDKTPSADTYYKFSPAALGTNSTMANTTLSIYPNPAASELFIETGQETNYVLCNALGGVILQGRLPLGQSAINTATVANGVYYLRLNQQGNTSIQKVIVQQQ